MSSHSVSGGVIVEEEVAVDPNTEAGLGGVSLS